MRKRYAVVLEKARRNWAAYCPDVDGCVATGKTAEATLASFAEALAFHFEGMALGGEAIPEPTAVVDYVEVEVAARDQAAEARASA